MSTIKFKARRIEGLSPTTGGTLEVECDMSVEQMKGALDAFLGKVTDQDWNDWLKDFAPEHTAALELADGAGAAADQASAERSDLERQLTNLRETEAGLMDDLQRMRADRDELLAGVRLALAALNGDDVSRAPMEPKLARCAQNWMRGLFGSQLQALVHKHGA